MAQPLPVDWFERFEHGVEEFNGGFYYDCHETLERCWQEQGLLSFAMDDPHREFVQGLIQVSVGYHHLQRNNVKGALKLLRRGLGRLKNFPLKDYPLDMLDFEAIVQSTIDILEAQASPGFADSLQSIESLEGVRFPKVAHK
jgi:predicted metal-dependent hydrolase